jgi:hypothetical protein
MATRQLLGRHDNGRGDGKGAPTMPGRRPATSRAIAIAAEGRRSVFPTDPRNEEAALDSWRSLSGWGVREDVEGARASWSVNRPCGAEAAEQSAET